MVGVQKYHLQSGSLSAIFDPVSQKVALQMSGFRSVHTDFTTLRDMVDIIKSLAKTRKVDTLELIDEDTVELDSNGRIVNDN